MSFSDEYRWEPIWLGDYQQPEPRTFALPIYFPISLSSPALRIRVLAVNARKSWRAAGELVQILGDVAGLDFEVETKFVPLNAVRLILFSEIADYRLKFYPKLWIDSFQIQIDKFNDL